MAKIKKRTIQPDYIHNSVSVAVFINKVMKKGKKTTAEKIVYDAFDEIKKKNKEPLLVFEEALKNATPLVEVRPKRVGGATYQVPVPVERERALTLATRWIIDAARSKKGKGMAKKLAEEIMASAENTGKAIKKKEDTHRMAEANRAFARFNW
ncbi:MAG: 30S ribosomal protein S7 [Candidatus Nealsonbacteria bacterium]|nr:30S ribosomal protein S7 [Candidatus Nealsonbacteria bacterium]